MTAALIQQALAFGYSAKQVLNFLQHQVPGLKQGIAQASKSGIPEEMILQFLSRQIPATNPKGVQKQLTDQAQYLKNIGHLTKGERAERRNEVIKGAAQVGLAGISGYRLLGALGSLGQQAAQAGLGPQPTPPTAPPGAPPGAPPAPRPTSPTPQPATPIPSPIQPAPPGGQGTPQQPGPLTPPPPPTPAPAPMAAPNPQNANLIKQMGFANVVKTLAPNEDPQTIAQVIQQHFLKPAQQKWLQTQSKDTLEKIVDDYMQLNNLKTPQEKAAAPAAQVLEQAKEPEILPQPVIAEAPIEAPKEAPTEKPQAILESGQEGTLEQVKNGIATVNVDGKPHHVKEDDIIESPIPQRELVDIYQELIERIPESARKNGDG